MEIMSVIYIKINFSEEEVLQQAEKTQAGEVKRIQLNSRTGKSLQSDLEKSGCFPRLKNFPDPKCKSETNLGNAYPRAEDARSVQPQPRLIWA